MKEYLLIEGQHHRQKMSSESREVFLPRHLEDDVFGTEVYIRETIETPDGPVFFYRYSELTVYESIKSAFSCV